MLIDTHCHLDAAEFGHTQAALITAAKNAGVSRLVIPSVERSNFSAVFELCRQHPECSPAYGIHPMFVERAIPKDLTVLRAQLTQHRPVALGEIGLDFFVEPRDQEKQEYYFIEQLKLAREFELPVLLHIRHAQDRVLKYLRKIKVCGGIAHAFNGSDSQAQEFLKLNFKLGFGGAMTYPRATRIRQLAATLPLSGIVLETDAPDIPPEFLAKGQPNKPEYLPRIAAVLAELRGMTLEEIAQMTTNNARAALPELPRHTPHAV